MALASGTRVGIYEVTAKIGEGGMGEVYQARDTTLDRDVALKVLPEAFTADPDRLARFQREAKVLASLNHQNIGGIYGLETFGDSRALVLELIEGPTLADRIAAGPIPVDEALEIAKQIAAALEAAHEQGIIHRDLKPANVKVRPDNTVKVLDFGLAKAVSSDASGSSGTTSVTMSLPASATQMGMVLGTAAYMAPEQARGKVVDKRADVWAFGVVIYEMLTGQRAFVGEDTSLTLAAVMTANPDMDRLPTALPTAVRKCLERCFQKDPRTRVRDIGDVQLAMEGAFETTVLAPPNEARATQLLWQRPGAWLVVSLIVVVGLAGLLVLQSPPTSGSRVVRFVESTEGRMTFPREGRAVAISPDGDLLVYAAKNELFLRELGSAVATQIPGSNDGTAPFFSPDGEWIGFFTTRQLKKVAVSGGEPFVVCDVPRGLSGTWGVDDTIVFSRHGLTGLFRVQASGGVSEQLTTRIDSDGDHDFADFLPDGEAVLFSISAPNFNFDDGQIVAQSLETGERTVVIDGGFNPRWIETGHLVYARGGGLFAVEFDPAQLQVKGEPVQFVSGVMQTGAAAQYAVSNDGSVVYVAGDSSTSAPEAELVWVDREGREEVLPVSPNSFVAPRVSPDGNRVIVNVDAATEADIWLSEISRGTLSLLTSSSAIDGPAIWSPDGEQIVFYSERDEKFALYRMSANGRGVAEHLVDLPGEMAVPSHWTADGSSVIFSYRGNNDSYDIGVLSVEGEPEWVPLLETEIEETNGNVSPDGQWIAYTSDETGSPEVYIERFPDLGFRTLVSTGGGRNPVWSKDGRELFYRDLDRGVLMAVEITNEPALVVGLPETLFSGRYGLTRLEMRVYDVSPDGQRFLMLKETRDSDDDGAARDEIYVGLNWLKPVQSQVSGS